MLKTLSIESLLTKPKTTIESNKMSYRSVILLKHLVSLSVQEKQTSLCI
jgi:hypothetical protein